MKKYTADFETCVWEKDETWVWAWATCEIGNEENISYGNNIEGFINFCKNSKNSNFYFHNLKFDGCFIIYYLLEKGFVHVKSKKEATSNSFITLINDLGAFYSITVYFEKKNKRVKKATFIDSLKIIPYPVSEIPKSFNLSESKLEIDYKKPRPKNHELTKDEIEYIKNDVVIVAKALNQMFNQNLTSITTASNALKDYKSILTDNKFNHYFPTPSYEADKDIRQSYKGGFTYLNPIYKEKDVENGVVLDVNSLYPSVLYECELPFGEGIFYKGKYEDDKVYPLYIQKITCSFKIKENKIPTIQIKNSMFYLGNEYLTTSNDEIECLILTSVDLKLFLEQYDVENFEYISGWKFKSTNILFRRYIDKWIKVKNESTILGNKGLRTIAKLMLNSLYGKLAKSTELRQKIPYMGDDEILHFEITEKEIVDGIYIPIASFITSYARNKTIRTSQAIKDYSINKYGIDKYIYSDTDSIHTTLSIEELKQFCEIDPIKLGAWKHEASFTKARFVRQKCYLEEIDNKIKITCAGLPKSCYDKVEWSKFKTGFTCSGKLTYKQVKRWGFISRFGFYY